MDSTDWIALGQLITALLGIVGVIVTLRLNTRAVRLSARTLGLNVDAQRLQADSDNRAHWWTRYTWAEDQRHNSDTRLQRLGWNHLDILVRSPLATATEAEIIQLIAIQRLNLPY
ncbi:MAG: hypothetical protein L0K27_01865 [Corynebacterium nuruki]|nr:hypothetical protein [Corynebacterium nuruki]